MERPERSGEREGASGASRSGERARRIIAAAVSATTIWVASAPAVRAATERGRDEGSASFHDASTRWRSAAEEVRRQFACHHACVARARVGCAGRADAAVRAARARAEAVRLENEAVIRALHRRHRRCARAVESLVVSVKAYRSTSDASSFWTNACANASSTLDPKRTVLVALNQTGESDSNARLRSSHDAYTRKLETLVSNLADNIDARAVYDAQYLANKTESLRNASRAVESMAVQRYEAMREASSGAIRAMNSSAHIVFDDVSEAAIAAIEGMRATIVNVSVDQALASFTASVNELATFTHDLNVSFYDVQRWFDEFDTSVRPVIEAIQDSQFDTSFQLPSAPDVTMPTVPSLSAPNFDFPTPTLSTQEFTDAMRESIDDFSARAAHASTSVANTLSAAISFDMVANLSIPSIVTDYDPPAFRINQSSTTSDSAYFTESIMQNLHATMGSFASELTGAASATTTVIDFGLNRTASAAVLLNTNFTEVNFEPDAENFEFLNLNLRMFQIPDILSVAEVAFAGFVNVDVTYRIIRCLAVVSKHFAYGALELEPLNMIDHELTAGSKKISVYERLARFFGDPVMVAVVRSAIFIAVAAAILHVYGQTRRSYIAGCVDSRNGTIASEYAHALARSYIDITARARAVSADARLAHESARACDVIRASATERFNVGELDRHRLETTLVSDRERLLSLQTCVRAVEDDDHIALVSARASRACVKELLALNDSAATTLECEQTTCSAASACVGPVDAVLEAHAIETACTIEHYAHDWFRRTMLFILAYVSMNVAREPFADALGRVLALTQNIDEVAVIARYDRRFDEVFIAQDSKSRVQRALRAERARGCVIMLACLGTQIPWFALSAQLN